MEATEVSTRVDITTPVIDDGRVPASVETVVVVVSDDEPCDGDILPTATPTVVKLLSTAMAVPARGETNSWRGLRQHVVPPYSVFTLRGGEVTSPKGVSFHPALCVGAFDACRDTAVRHLRAILDARLDPVFYIGSTTDLLWRWRDITDRHGKPCGHRFNRISAWWAEVALCKMGSGNECG